jgi:hypothetical protein
MLVLHTWQFLLGFDLIIQLISINKGKQQNNHPKVTELAIFSEPKCLPQEIIVSGSQDATAKVP